jgi:hypothetical protein
MTIHDVRFFMCTRTHELAYSAFLLMINVREMLTRNLPAVPVNQK